MEKNLYFLDFFFCKFSISTLIFIGLFGTFSKKWWKKISKRYVKLISKSWIYIHLTCTLAYRFNFIISDSIVVLLHFSDCKFVMGLLCRPCAQWVQHDFEVKWVTSVLQKNVPSAVVIYCCAWHIFLLHKRYSP